MLDDVQAVQAGPDIVCATAARHASMLHRQQDWAGAVAILAQHGVNGNPAHFELYREVVLDVLGASQRQRQPAAEQHAK